MRLGRSTAGSMDTLTTSGLTVPTNTPDPPIKRFLSFVDACATLCLLFIQTYGSPVRQPARVKEGHLSISALQKQPHVF